MVHLVKQLVIFILLLFTISCTDERKLKNQIITVQPPPRTDMQFVKDFFPIQNAENIVYQIKAEDNSLYLTGKPFGFARYNIISDPESPDKGKVFIASEQMSTFVMHKPEPGRSNEFSQPAWTVDFFASGALGILKNIAFLSGTRGLSIVDISETNYPREIKRFPRQNEDLDYFNWVIDEAYNYKAIISHPSKLLLYAFREQDYVYTLAIGGPNGLSFLRKDSYLPNSTMCCVKGATLWQNKVFVAFQSKLVYFDISDDGFLINGTEINELQATNVASTQDYLFVMHEPSNGNLDGVNHPKGIYVFDLNGRQVALLTALTTKVFAVHPNNAYLYANDDNRSIKIYKINWINKY